MRQGRILWVPLGYREAMTHASSTDLDRVLASLDPTPSGTYAFSLVDEIPQNVDIFALIRDEDSYTVVVEEDAARKQQTNADKPPEPLPQQQRRDLALLAQLHRRDRTFIPHNNQALQHPLVHRPRVDRIEVNPCPTLKTGDRRNPPLDQNPHTHGDR